MPPPSFKCWQCNKQLWGTWSVQQLKCPYCGAICKVPRREFTCTEQLGTCANREQRKNSDLARLFAKLKGKNGKPANSSMSSSTHNMDMCTTPRPKKRALLCGVTYQKRKYRLKGTINDVWNMVDLLMNHFQFPKDCIRILTDGDKNEDLRPTRKNILDSLKWLVEDCQAGDSLVFYFSGHGLQQVDENGDEDDGLDETICPLDFFKEGMIVDDEINETIVRPLVEGVTLHAIVDACHSGTILDLTCIYNKEKKDWEDNIIPSVHQKSTSGGLAICLSACEDDKKAADSTAFKRKSMNGVLTYLLADTIRKFPKGISYAELIDTIDEKILAVYTQDKCLPSSFLSKFFRHKGLLQNIQLSSSEKFDVRKNFRL